MAELTADLVYWISEREGILQRRMAGMAPPWSADPIFQTVRFCNVHREDDAVTKWIREHWNKASDPAWKFVLGRMVNLPESLQELLNAEPYNAKEFMIQTWKSNLKMRRDQGNKVFTSAYTISTCGKKMDKLDYVFDVVVAAVAEMGEPEYRSLQACHENLMCIDGLGSFLSAQVIADMKNTPGHPLENAPDWWTFSAPGPGSLRGLSWWRKWPITAKHYASTLADCRRAVDPLVPSWISPISDQDFQNCLCEFSKYCKVKYLNGHVRNRYVANHTS
jgi:hypothetical protein